MRVEFQHSRLSSGLAAVPLNPITEVGMLESGPPARLGIFSIKANPVTPPRHVATQLDSVPSC
jgi:hypothetical protein